MILYCGDCDEQFDTDVDVETHRFHKDTSGNLFTTPTSWRPMFHVPPDEWAGNAQRFATEEEALASARARFNVWMVPDDFRADPTDDPVNYKWDKGDVSL